MTLNYWDSGEVTKPNGVVGGLILGREITSLLDGKKISQVIKHLPCSKKSKKKSIKLK